MTALVPLIAVDALVKILGAVGGFIVTVGGFGLAVYKTLPKKAPPPTPVQQTAAEVEVVRGLLEEAREATREAREATADARKEADYLRTELTAARAEIKTVRAELADCRRELDDYKEADSRDR